VKHGDVNATLPRGREPADLTLEQAVELISERAAKGPSKGKSRRGKFAKKAEKVEAGEPAAANGKAKSAKPRAKPKGKAAKPAGTREAAE